MPLDTRKPPRVYVCGEPPIESHGVQRSAVAGARPGPTANYRIRPPPLPGGD
jgi:hypothetical protein